MCTCTTKQALMLVFFGVALYKIIPFLFSIGAVSNANPWNRRDKDKNHIISSRVTDTVAATYVHTLRVTGRRVGSYSCSVSNSRTSPPAATTLQIAGKEPEISCDFSCIGPFRLLVIAELSIHYFTLT